MRISIADRQISSRFAAYRLRRRRKYRFTYCPLIHRRRDDGPPSPQSLPTSGMRGKVGVGVVSRHDDGHPTPSSHQRRATFPLSGKSTPQSLPTSGMRGKVGVGVDSRHDDGQPFPQSSAKPSGGRLGCGIIKYNSKNKFCKPFRH